MFCKTKPENTIHCDVHNNKMDQSPCQTLPMRFFTVSFAILHYICTDFVVDIKGQDYYQTNTLANVNEDKIFYFLYKKLLHGVYFA